MTTHDIRNFILIDLAAIVIIIVVCLATHPY